MIIVNKKAGLTDTIANLQNLNRFVMLFCVIVFERNKQTIYDQMEETPVNRVQNENPEMHSWFLGSAGTINLLIFEFIDGQGNRSLNFIIETPIRKYECV